MQITTTDLAVMTPFEYVERCDSGELWKLLDVREPWEYRIANVEGSVLMPMAEVPVRYCELDRNDRVAVLCHTGVRSAAVATWLLQHGLKTVANVAGGIDAWSVTVDGSVPRY
jgi:rhodanese-related sulfurtransferase